MHSHMSYGDLVPELPDGGIEAYIEKTVSDPLKILQNPYLDESTRIALIRNTDNTVQRVRDLLSGKLDSDPLIHDYTHHIALSLSQDVLRPHPDKLRQWIELLLSCNTDERRQCIQQDLHEAYEKGLEAFIVFLDSISKLNMTEIALNRAWKGDMKDVFREPLELHRTITQCALQEFQSDKHHDFEQLQKILSQFNPQNRDSRIDMSTASVPQHPYHIEQYTNGVAEWLKGHHHDFNHLMDAFNEIAEDIFGKQNTAFITKGTTSAFTSMALEMIEGCQQTLSDNVRFITTPGEYHAMLSSLRYRLYPINVSDPSFTEDDILENIQKECLNKKNRSEALVFVLSSSLRMGGKQLDIDTLCQRVKLWTQQHNVHLPEIHLWIDASQDSRVFQNADITFYSKRNGTIVVVNKEKYTATEFRNIPAAASMRSGFDTRLIGQAIGVMFDAQDQQRFSLKRLLHEPHVWEKESNIHSLQSQIESAQLYIEQSAILSRFFKLVAPELDVTKPNSQSDVLLRLNICEPDAFDIATLQEQLYRHGIEVGNFSLSNLPAVDNKKPIESLRKKLYADDALEWSIFEDLTEFETRYASSIVWSLSPPDIHTSNLLTLTEKKKVQYIRDYFEKAVRLHDFFRLYITADDRPGRLVAFLQTLEKIVSEMKVNEHPDSSAQK